MAILDDNEFVEVEGRYYVNPQVSLDESNAFIDNLRSTQQANNQQIQTDTYNLGTEISSNLGGLTSPVGEGGAGDAGLSYFTSRYQTPQTNAVVENLRAVAQANALNQVLANEQEIWKKRYNDAYRNYQKRASSGGGSGGTDPSSTTKGGVDEKDTSKESTFDYSNSVAGVDNYYSVIGPDGIAHLVPFGEEYKTEIILKPDGKTNKSGANGKGYSGGGGGGGGGGGR